MKYKPDIDALFKRILEKDDQVAFRLLFLNYYNPLCLYSFRYLQNMNLSQEAVSEVFVKLWIKRKDIKIKKSFQSFLYTSVRNQSIDILRKTSKTRNFVPYDLNMKASNYSPEEELQYKELLESIEKGIDRLPAQCKKIFLLSRNEQFSYQEIADKLEISLKTVKTQMYRAIKKLKSFIKVEK